MSDLISRKAAIDELSQRYIIMDNPHYIGYNAGLDEAQKVIKALPPVQMDDAISRKAAIYVASGYCHPSNVAQELAKLPSVQPTHMRSIGKLIGYTGEPCPNCGRLRVEHYESGLEICEKCNWCEQTKSYWLDWEEG